ncbi:translation initiation factor IF-2, mitochondrial-like [Rhopilema esculentum]|uniref:translation initiation factor IF-2, mitochondrial-like n=1 Tax=Rhopilema esculentum TaxID=499914 RepID=UPI0031E29064
MAHSLFRAAIRGFSQKVNQSCALNLSNEKSATCILSRQKLFRSSVKNCRCLATFSKKELREEEKTSDDAKSPKEVVLDVDLTIKKLAKKIGTSTGSIMKLLKDAGEEIDKGVHTTLDLDIAEFVALEFGFQPILPDIDSWEKLLCREIPTSSTTLHPRPPVVTIMGHVDHGKTTLLDKLRKTAVAEHEAGGITQHIGAFSVNLPSGKTISFIDTPGHAAFNAMRGRGARVTDIVVLVISAEDGVKEQTLECIKHAKEAKVPIIVAINKVDKGRANPAKVKQELLQYGIQLEEFGGDVPAVEISALKDVNLDLLEEMIIAQAEISELRAKSSGFAQGVVLEAQTHRQKGMIASVLVQNGKLLRGDSIVAGNAFAKVRQLLSDNGKPLTEATPSTPVQILGWRKLPTLGDQFMAVESEDIAKKIIKLNEIKERRQKEVEFRLQDENLHTLGKIKAKVESGSRKIPMRVKLRREAASQSYSNSENDKPILSLVIKADYGGSLEAILDILKAFKSEMIDLEVVSSGFGQITEGDINLADAVKGIVYGFNVTASKEVEQLSNRVGIPIKKHNVIYKLVDDIKEEISSKLPEQTVEHILGEANVLQVFVLTGQKKAAVAGCRVKKGSLTVEKDVVWRVIRDEVVLHEGPLVSLKYGKQDIALAKKETECGVVLRNFTDFEADDKIQCIKISYVKQQLDFNNLQD